MSNPDYAELLEAALRGPLTDAQQQRLDRMLAEDAGLREAWELDQALTDCCKALPKPVPSSNFTALVLQAAVRDAAAARPGRRWVWPSWPRLAQLAGTVSVVCLLAFVTVRQRRAADRQGMAETLAAVSEISQLIREEGHATPAAALPTVAVWQDFEAIRRLQDAPAGADLGLLAVLEQ